MPMRFREEIQELSWKIDERGIFMELYEIRNFIGDMHGKLDDFRGSL